MERSRGVCTYKRFQLIKIDIYNILKKINSDLRDKKYFCGVCRLIRFEIISKILKNPRYNFHEKIRASIDGTSLNRSSFCPDSIDLDTLGINSLIPALPIFTPVIGFGKGRIKDLASKISKNLRNINYCPFQPENQEYDSEKLKNIYNDLKIDKLLEESIKNGLEIKIF